MSIGEWFPRLDESTRQWMIDHNGEVILPGVLLAIGLVGGTMDPDAWRVGQTHGQTGYYLSDEAVEFIASRTVATALQ